MRIPHPLSLLLPPPSSFLLPPSSFPLPLQACVPTMGRKKQKERDAVNENEAFDFELDTTNRKHIEEFRLRVRGGDIQRVLHGGVDAINFLFVLLGNAASDSFAEASMAPTDASIDRVAHALYFRPLGEPPCLTFCLACLVLPRSLPLYCDSLCTLPSAHLVPRATRCSAHVQRGRGNPDSDRDGLPCPA
jgi:hypothetical protein